jgi:hypothetical protein
MTLKHLISAIAFATAALGAHAQYQVASSVGGSTVAAAPINQADIYNRINTAQGTANTAQGTATDAQWRANDAKGTANWAGGLAQQADANASNAHALAESGWQYARTTNIAACTTAMQVSTGIPAAYWIGQCTAQANPHP